jgi:SAM-dependent methyltransferase
VNLPAREPAAVIRAADYLTGDKFELRPTRGGWWAITPMPADLGRYYPSVYYGAGGRRFPQVVEWLQAALYRYRAKWVTRVSGSVGRVLDVGCGPGHLLSQFRALGWEAIGTEATETSAAIPRQRYGLKVHAGELSTLRLDAGSFDAVISWHSLEHMRDPGVVLDEYVRLLKPGGVLFVSVPNFSSPEAQAQPSAWFHLDVPRHVVQFPLAVLRVLLHARGFQIVEESFFAPEYDTFSLMQTWQNRIGLPHNLLYLCLKRARKTAPESTVWQAAMALLLSVPLFPVALFFSAWRGWRGRGAVVVVLARKT